MQRRRFAVVVGIACGGLAAACGADSESMSDETAAAAEVAASSGTAAGSQEVALECVPQRESVEGRASPYDSTLITIGDAEAKLCYGRPSARGRTMIGGENVPYETLWRTGANEPTTLHLPFAATIAGVAVQPGSYSIYTIPTPEDWTVIVNASTSQWGHESQYTEEVEAQEVGRGTVPSEALEEHVEMFTITAEPAGADRANLVLEWERTRVQIPIVRQGAGVGVLTRRGVARGPEPGHSVRPGLRSAVGPPRPALPALRAERHPARRRRTAPAVWSRPR